MVMTASIDSFAHNVDINVLREKCQQYEYQDAFPLKSAVAPAKQLIGDALSKKIDQIHHDECEPGEEDTFYVADLGEVFRQHVRWCQNLPRVRPFFAVKSNPDTQVLRLLAKLGAGFDCASKTEIEQVLGIGVDANSIVYAQPCKTNSYVRFVRSKGVKRMTFDNADELHKIAKLYPGAELLLRIMTDDTSSLCRLSMKFGAALDTTDSLLTTAKELGLNVIGVSFHVGSGASDPLAFLKAVRDAHTVFQEGRDHGFNMNMLDVGGGFCSDTFDHMSGVLNNALDEYFPEGCGVELIAEPGRFYVSTAFTIACNIIARRTVEDPTLDGKGYMVYLNDGVYGNFSCIMFDHQNPEARILRSNGRIMYNKPEAHACPPGEGVEYSLWGPTCDGIDRISESTRFEHILDVGDWMYFEDMGAYTRCSATKFNGFSDVHEVIYVCSEPAAQILMGM